MNKLNDYYRKFVYAIADIFSQNIEKDSEEYQIRVYYTFMAIDSIIKISVYLLIAYYCGVFFITLPILISFSASKLFSFGLHLRNHLACTLLSLGIFVGGAFLVRLIPNIAIMTWIRLGLWILCTILFLIFAPMDSAVRTIYSNERKQFKLQSLAVVIIIGLCMILFSQAQKPVTANALMFGLLAQTIFILPCISKESSSVEK